MVKGYCVRCKEKVPMDEVRIEKTSKGGYMAKGKCSKDDKKTTVCAMMSKDNAEKAIEAGEAKKAF